MLFTRLLPLLCLLSLSTVSVGQNHPRIPVVPSSCPVTKPADQPFVPPAPYPAKPSGDRFWFGTDRLWTTLPVTGTSSGLPHYTPTGPTYREKLPFWRQGYDPHNEPRPNLTVTGRRIDGPAGPLQSDGKGNGSWTKDDQFIMTGINFPTVGCWEVTGHYETEALTFVIWVAPFADEARCGPHSTRLQPKAPAYADAMRVEKTLTEKGYQVECVLASKMDNFFGVQEGAALFRTTTGDFEVLFLPEPYNFDALDITEERKGNLIAYSFRGKAYFEREMQGKRVYFVKRSRMLFIAYDRDVAGTLNALF